MKRQPPDDRKSEPAAANDHQPISDRPDFESSIDLEDALMLAIFDSVVKPKRKKARGHFAQRRPKSPF
jgi:hypothetical protein